jgi:TIR domain
LNKLKPETIFISHSRSDTEFARRLVSDLNRVGVPTWLDVIDIPPNAEWEKSIEEALSRSAYLLIVWSNNSATSHEVLAEVFQAKADGKKLIHVRIDGQKPPAAFNKYQHIDFRNDYDFSFSQLCSYLPVATRERRLKEIQLLLPENPFPELPGF